MNLSLAKRRKLKFSSRHSGRPSDSSEQTSGDPPCEISKSHQVEKFSRDPLQRSFQRVHLPRNLPLQRPQLRQCFPKRPVLHGLVHAKALRVRGQLCSFSAAAGEPAPPPSPKGRRGECRASVPGLPSPPGCWGSERRKCQRCNTSARLFLMCSASDGWLRRPPWPGSTKQP